MEVQNNDGAPECEWLPLFHTKEETQNAPPITFAIEEFLQADGITLLGGLPGHGKTLVALAMVRALLEGSPLFGHFKVPRHSDRVIYLIPESGLSPFAARLKVFNLVKHVGDRFLYRTFSARDGEDVPIADTRIKQACEGADVFLDTVVRFMDGDENAAAEQKIFARNLFALLSAGARTVTGLHHSPKKAENANYMSLENVLRGSGDIGAMLATCWGKQKLGVLGTLSSGGSPQSANVGIAVTPELEIIFDTVKSSRKFKNLMSNPRCSFVIGWTGEITVQHEGEARQPEGAALAHYQEVVFRPMARMPQPPQLARHHVFRDPAEVDSLQRL